ncbi:MAG: hypothetical protein QNK04_10780 [Myxococcota bacterium]|nr:hypothetical protein [Myxococcota bacterium]
MSDDQDPKPRPGEDERPLPLHALGSAHPAGASLLFFALAFFPPALAAVGAAVAYELWGSLAGSGIGALLGGGVGLLAVRDFMRWRLRPVTAVTVLILCGLFTIAYW